MLKKDGKQKEPGKYQFVWWCDWHGFHFLKPSKDSSLKYIYDWFWYLGFLEIRKWHVLTDKEKEELG